MPKVLNKYKDIIPKDAVYIMRPGILGNPFVIGKDGTREDVIIKHKKWFLSQSHLIEYVKTNLCGKDLVCCCKPLACHGDIYLKVANLSKELKCQKLSKPVALWQKPRLPSLKRKSSIP